MATPAFLAAPVRATRDLLTRRDPLIPTLLIVGAFFFLGLCRLAIPSKMMFDEIHYVPAARRLIELTKRLNPEHPLLGKEMIAIGIRLFGDHPFGWRFPNLVLGTAGLFAGARAMWWLSGSRRVSLLFATFLATDFIWFVLSRIAMLDMAMASMLALAMWQWALSARAQWAARRGGRIHLILAGLFFGLSLGGKWNGAPLMVLPGLLFAWQRAVALDLVPMQRPASVPAALAQAGRALPRWLLATRAGPVRGVSLLEAALWLGLWPLVVYLATFAPAFFYKVQPMTFSGLIPWQRYMLQLQDSVVKPHHYMSRWWQWVFNLRPIWFLYEPVDGAQRGILMLGNPFTMLAGLPALGWCGWKAWRGEAVPALVFVLYVLSLIFWAINGKPVQFYYHYELAASFLMAALALVLGTWWDNGLKWPAKTALVLTVIVSIGFYPIISAGPLPGKKGYVDYMWLKSWR
ncbi:glycosyl transferase family protein [Novosphingobium nitrogenifigens DSM 19370]|uniref:Polyprenol-phosphate-mannose--protein mannosyltransferase n=1 Tax=Novosphingobium nitrogenifigens DSM 19370 TaxID=983920 RepID=F1Z711_9SPHN|nr:phospholipid carrier-dependent glycosyltransferase [Novosphingobium nitrogenifigens]EGD59615.1 glycosyl transferase family protein [Novosphingobium nitrogenifigens DSM 19370]